MKLKLFWFFMFLAIATWANKYQRLWSGDVDPNNRFDIVLIHGNQFVDLMNSLIFCLILWFIIALFFKNRGQTIAITLVSFCVFSFFAVLGSGRNTLPAVSTTPTPTLIPSEDSRYVYLSLLHIRTVLDISNETFDLIQKPFTSEDISQFTDEYRSAIDFANELEPPQAFIPMHKDLQKGLQHCYDFADHVDTLVSNHPSDEKVALSSYEACFNECQAVGNRISAIAEGSK